MKKSLVFGVLALFAMVVVLAGCATGEAKKIPQSCKDSDGGLNYYAAGSVKVGTSIYLDSCSRTNKYDLKEYYCKGASVLSTKYKCTNGCLNSACISNIINTTNQTTCKDSDGGKNYSAAGMATGIYDGKTGIIWGNSSDRNRVYSSSDSTLDYSIFYDHCFNSETSNQLNEGFCENNQLSSYGYNCPNGCKDGVCVTQATNQTNSTG